MKPLNPLHSHHHYPEFGKVVDKKQLVTNMIIAVITVGLSLLVVIITSNIAGPIPISVSQTSSERIEPFSVEGKSEMVTTPDELQVTVGVEATGSTAEQVKNQVNATTSNIIEALEDLGVESDDMRTLNYSVRPNYNYDTPERTISGYTVSTSLEIKTEQLDMLNQIIDTATALGANRVNNVSFGMSAETEQELTKEARKLAIEDAKRNAKELAGLAGMNLDRVINVIEHSSPGPVPVRYDAMELRAEGFSGAPTDIQPGTSSMEYQVTLVYETK